VSTSSTVRRIGAVVTLAAATAMSGFVVAPAQAAVSVACPQTADLKTTQRLLNVNKAALTAANNAAGNAQRNISLYINERGFAPTVEDAAHYNKLITLWRGRLDLAQQQISRLRDQRRTLVVNFVKRNPTISLICLDR
jgi:hypothetical protein